MSLSCICLALADKWYGKYAYAYAHAHCRCGQIGVCWSRGLGYGRGMEHNIPAARFCASSGVRTLADFDDDDMLLKQVSGSRL
jgi:hypothetical protein